VKHGLVGILHTFPCPVEEEHQGIFFCGIVILGKIFNIIKGVMAVGLPLFLYVHKLLLSFLGNLSCIFERFVIECRKIIGRR
jgi:hypothetical protein